MGAPRSRGVRFHSSYARQYESEARISFSSRRLTSFETEVFSSAAFLRAQ